MDDHSEIRNDVVQKLKGFQIELETLEDSVDMLVQLSAPSRDWVPKFDGLTSPDIVSLGASSTDALENQLRPACDEASETVRTVTAEARKFRDDFRERVNALLASVKTFVEQDGDLRELQETEVTRVHEGFGEARVNLEKVFDDVSAFLKAATEEVQDDLTQRFNSGADGYIAGFQSHLENLLPELLRRMLGLIDDSIGAFKSVAEQTGRAYGDRAKRIFEEAEHEAQAALSGAMNEVVNGIRDVLLDRVAREIASSISETLISAQISAAITPIVPQLVVAYRGTEVLKDAIRIKNLGT